MLLGWGWLGGMLRQQGGPCIALGLAGGDALSGRGILCPPRTGAGWGGCSGREGDPASPWGWLGGDAQAARGTLCPCGLRGQSRTQASSQCWGSAAGTSQIHGTHIPFGHSKMLGGVAHSRVHGRTLQPGGWWWL